MRQIAPRVRRIVRQIDRAIARAVRPEVHFQPTSFDLQGWEIVGGYGWQPRWGDGHRTGIYSFLYLQRLGAEG